MYSSQEVLGQWRGGGDLEEGDVEGMALWLPGEVMVELAMVAPQVRVSLGFL